MTSSGAGSTLSAFWSGLALQTTEKMTRPRVREARRGKLITAVKGHARP